MDRFEFVAFPQEWIKPVVRCGLTCLFNWIFESPFCVAAAFQATLFRKFQVFCQTANRIGFLFEIEEKRRKKLIGFQNCKPSEKPNLWKLSNWDIHINNLLSRFTELYIKSICWSGALIWRRGWTWRVKIDSAEWSTTKGKVGPYSSDRYWNLLMPLSTFPKHKDSTMTFQFIFPIFYILKEMVEQNIILREEMFVRNSQVEINLNLDPGLTDVRLFEMFWALLETRDRSMIVIA